MNQKKFTYLVFIATVVVIVAGGYFFLIKKQAPFLPATQSPAVTMKDSKSVCLYVQQDAGQFKVDGTEIPFDKCNDYICSARDNGESWNVSYRCPGPPSFPMGQSYSIEVDKTTQAIRVTGATN